MTDHFLYIIAAQHGNEISAPVKVGISGNPRSRLDGLQTACPFKIVLFKTLRLPSRSIARDVEDCFHSTQKERRLHGEWFDIQPSEVAAILELQIRFFLSAFTSLSDDETKIAMSMVTEAAV